MRITCLFNIKVKKTASLLHILLLILWLTLPAMAFSQTKHSPKDQLQGQKIKTYYEPNKIIVGFKPKITAKKAKKIIEQNKHTVDSKISKLNTYIVTVKGNAKKELIKYKKNSSVKFAELNYNIEKFSMPNDPLFDQQYGPQIIQAPEAWEIERGQSNFVTVAIIDTGVSKSHPELKDKLVPGYDFINNDSDPDDDEGHGTHVAGIASATTDNNEGIAGISWHAKIMPIKVLDASGSGTWESVSKGIVWAADNGADVINMSLGGAYPSEMAKQAVNYAYNKGVTIIASAGNSGDSHYYYPASFDVVISIAATDSSDNRAWFSTFNDKVDLAAPGVYILSSVLDGDYESWSGTSMSSPHVSGLASLVLSYNPDLTPAQIEEIIKLNADDVNAETYPGYDIYIGEGRINANRAVANPSSELPIAKIIKPSNDEKISGVIIIEGIIDDSQGGENSIIEAQYSIDSSEPVPMNAKDGAFDSSIEEVVAEADTDLISNGKHTISIRGKDSDGNWSYPASVLVTVMNLNIFAEITYPDPISSEESFSGIIQITGTAKHKYENQFFKYVLEYQKNHSSEESMANNHQWNEIGTYYQPVDNGVLGTWDVSEYAGNHKLRLAVYDTNDNKEVDVKYIRIKKIIKGKQ